MTFAQCSASVSSNKDEDIDMTRSWAVWVEGIQPSDSLDCAILCARLSYFVVCY